MQSPSGPTGQAGANSSPTSRFFRRLGVGALSTVYLLQSVALGAAPAQAQVSPPSSGQSTTQSSTQLSGTNATPGVVGYPYGGFGRLSAVPGLISPISTLWHLSCQRPAAGHHLCQRGRRDPQL